MVCTVILFLLDLSSLNNDILFLSLFFNAYDFTLHCLEIYPLNRYSSHSPESDNNSTSNFLFKHATLDYLSDILLPEQGGPVNWDRRIGYKSSFQFYFTRKN